VQQQLFNRENFQSRELRARSAPTPQSEVTGFFSGEILFSGDIAKELKRKRATSMRFNQPPRQIAMTCITRRSKTSSSATS